MNNWAKKGDVHNKAYDFPATDYDKEGKDMFNRDRCETETTKPTKEEWMKWAKDHPLTQDECRKLSIWLSTQLGDYRYIKGEQA
jgi:hypothetical protein